ncbi:hypothetical protein ACTWP5_18825 [Streptomyces sp. 4N509B]|uniref:hypothetical protein n=1 Tax=Streptomyces sp. 4N509B TaxID=3457413 RepID=UPI003FD5E89E
MPDTKTVPPLTVAELRTLMRDVPGDTIVVLSADSEGNRYSPLFEIAEGMYDSDELLGDVYPIPEQLRQQPELRTVYPNGIPATAVSALILYPQS